MIELTAPVAIVWEITNKCNLKCPHCRAYMENPTRHTDVEQAVINEIISNRVLSVNISGGEPLLHPNLIKFVEQFSMHGIDVGISTNGWFYNDYAPQLRNAGLNFVQISVDGPQKIHDSFRGCEGSYQHAVNAIKTAIKYGHFVQMNVTLTAFNLPYVLDNIRLAESLGVNRVFFRRVVSAGLSKINFSVLPERKEYYKALNAILSFQVSSSTLVSVDDPIVRVIRPSSAYDEVLSCSAGITSLGIDSNGDIYPCIFLREKIGNVLKNSLADIWANSNVLRKLRNREIEVCGDCKFKLSCGGCRAFSGIYSKDSFCPLG